MSLEHNPARQDGVGSVSGGRIFDDYFEPDEAAAQVGVCRRTLDRWHRLREGPPRTIVGRKILYHKQSLRDWVRAQEQSFDLA